VIEKEERECGEYTNAANNSGTIRSIRPFGLFALMVYQFS
jgi:hypothetical protein